MKFLVTGGAGFIGSNAVDTLVSQEHDVIVVDNECAPENSKFYWRDDTENHKINILDYDDLVPLMEGVDYVLHFAAESRIQPSIIDPRYAINVNVTGTTNILQAAREKNVKRVMYSSTSAAYGLKNTVPLKEDMPTDCLNPYSVGKVGGEEVCKMYYNLFGVETVIFRYFNVYGDRSPTKGQYAPVVGLFFRQVLEGNNMTIVGDGEQRRDYTHVNDIVNANILAALSDNNDILGEIFNVGTGRNHSVNELAKLIGQPYEYIPARQGEARETLADNSKLRSMIGWEPTIRFEDWIEENKPKIEKPKAKTYGADERDLKVRTGRLLHTHPNQYADWVIGSFVEDPDFHSDSFEFKFQKGKKGEKREPKIADEPDTKTLPILIYGSVKVSFDDGIQQIFLRQEGDYVHFKPNEPHGFEFLEDSLIITLRWK